MTKQHNNNTKYQKQSSKAIVSRNKKTKTLFINFLNIIVKFYLILPCNNYKKRSENHNLKIFKIIKMCLVAQLGHRCCIWPVLISSGATRNRDWVKILPGDGVEEREGRTGRFYFKME